MSGWRRAAKRCDFSVASLSSRTASRPGGQLSAPAGSDLEILAARYGWSESIWELEQQGEDPFKDGWKDCMDVVRPTHAAHAILASLKAGVMMYISEPW